MSWLTNLVFAARRTAEARAALYADWLRDEREEKETALRNVARMAADLDNREQRLQEQAKTIADLRAQLDARRPERASVARLREELEQQKRVTDRLTEQLLDATGHNGKPLTSEQRAKLGLAEVRS